tara:strand:+ start:589 stop:843 length:255 start_codon:yes stop_codon:yes gene_type:complete
MTIMDDMAEILRLASTITDPLPPKKVEGDRYDMTVALSDSDGNMGLMEQHLDIGMVEVRNILHLLQSDNVTISSVTIKRRTRIL